MIGMIEHGQIDAILCWNINRLARNMEEGSKIAQLIIDGAIQEIRTPSGRYTTGDNVLSLFFESVSATQFSLDHSKNMVRGMGSKFKKGGCNYKTPQGYLNARDPMNPDIGTVIKDPQRFDLIRKGWDMFLTGAYTPVQVIRTLNDVWGYRTRQTKKLAAAPLGDSFGYKIFKNQFYAGYVKQNGKIVKSSEFEAMVSAVEFARVQELLKTHKKQAYRTHELAYTALMICSACGQQVTGEIRNISSGEWENYCCSNSYGKCTKHGMSRVVVENKIVESLDSITVHADLCKIALDNIIRNLNSQTAGVHSLYEQQNSALGQIETKLNNLAEMWISGLMHDEATYKTKELALTTERSNLIVEVDTCRNELEHMRANAIAASNYVVFARDNFMVSSDSRKREIAHALGTEYLFNGKEKTLDLQVHPLLLEVVKFTREVQASCELEKSGSNKEKTGDFAPVLSSGGPKEIRTPDLFHAMEARYQLCYGP
jgi:hypothetical protein